MISSLFMVTSAALAPAVADELATKAKFCLAVPARPESAEDILALVRERDGWSRIDKAEAEWNGTGYSVRTYQKGANSARVALSSDKSGVFCRYDLSVHPASLDEVVSSVQEIYLRRAAIITINPYEFVTGVGERVHFEIVSKTEDALQLRITVSTTQASAPF